MMARQERATWGHWEELINWTPEQLIAKARQRAEALGIDLSSNDHRNVVNMLRHDYTYYDDKVKGTSSERIYGEILDEIARDFPWLAAQCERDKASHLTRLSPRLQATRYTHQDALARQRVARDIAKTLYEGAKVVVSWRGDRHGRVMEVRRSRVKVEIELSDGTKRVVDVSADKARQSEQ